MVTRTLQRQNGSYFSVIPGALIDSLGLRPGDKVSFRIEDKKIIITPASPLSPAGVVSHDMEADT